MYTEGTTRSYFDIGERRHGVSGEWLRYTEWPGIGYLQGMTTGRSEGKQGQRTIQPVTMASECTRPVCFCENTEQRQDSIKPAIERSSQGEACKLVENKATGKYTDSIQRLTQLPCIEVLSSYCPMQHCRKRFITVP